WRSRDAGDTGRGLVGGLVETWRLAGLLRERLQPRSDVWHARQAAAIGHGRSHRPPQRPASAFITAFCTCKRLPASCTAMQAGESITASLALTLRRSGRQWLKTASLVRAILASSTMKCRYRSRIGFSGAQLPKYGSAPQLL